MSAQEPLSPEREAQIRDYIVGLMKSGASDRMVKESLQQLGIDPSSVLHLIRDAMVQAKAEPAQSPAKYGSKLKTVQERKQTSRNMILYGIFAGCFGAALYFFASNAISGTNLVSLIGLTLGLIGVGLFFYGLYLFSTAHD